MTFPAKVRPHSGPSKENICAVVVTYFPDAGFPARLRQICDQVDQAIVVDNGSDSETLGHVPEAVPGGRVAVIHNTANLGIATALNQGVRVAREKGYAWVLLLDQDTTPWPHTVRRLTQAFAEFPGKDRLALIGCNRFLKAPAAGTRWWTSSKAVITSGSLLSLDAAEVIGPFRDEFFIDCVDFEFCLRARARGFEIVEILEPIMAHAIGNPQPVRLGWIRGRTSNHRPWRWYYMVRNNLVVIREYFWGEPMWALRAPFVLWFAFSLALLFETARLEKLRYAFLGLGDGIRRRFDRVIIR